MNGQGPSASAGGPFSFVPAAFHAEPAGAGAFAIDTVCLAAGSRFAFWEEAVSRLVLPLRARTPAPEAFNGAIRSHRAGDALCSLIEASAQRVSRARREIARTGEAFYLLVMPLEGELRLRHAGVEAALGPGDCALIDTTLPHELEFPQAFRQLAFQAPQDWWRAVAGQTPAQPGRPISGRSASGALLGHAMAGAAVATRRGGADDAFAAARLVRLAQDVLAHAADAGLTGPALRRAQARALIRRHARDPAFGPTSLAAQLGLSRRRLDALFAGDSSVGEQIRRTRLQGALADLRDPALGGRSITEIALSWGFSSSQYFAHCFRVAYGCAPRAARRPGFAQTST